MERWCGRNKATPTHRRAKSPVELQIVLQNNKAGALCQLGASILHLCYSVHN